MLNNIVDNIRADSIPLHSDYPILMQSKLFIRSLCRAKVDWDQPLDEEFLKS